MNKDLTGIIVGVLAGLLFTVLITYLWPRNTLRWLRPIASAGVGFLIAWGLMTAL
jgi:hypothetical protein